MSDQKIEPSPLRESCVLVAFHGGYYNWTRRDVKTSKETSQAKTNHEQSYTAYKNIFVGTDGILAQIKQVINDARSEHYSNTLPAPKGWGDFAFISNMLVPDYKAAMLTFHHKLDALKMHLRQEWQTMLSAAQTHLGPAFNASEYPDVEVVCAASYIEISWKPVPDGKDITHPTLTSIRDQVQQEVSEAYGNNVMEVWKRLHEYIGEAHKNLAKLSPSDGRFRVEWLDNLRNVLPALRALNISEDQKFEEMAKEAEKLLKYEKDELKEDTSKRSELLSEVERIMARMSALRPASPPPMPGAQAPNEQETA